MSDCSPASLRPSKVPEPRYPSLKVVVLDHHPFQKACANYLTLELTRPHGNTRVWHQAPMRRCHPRVTKGARKKKTNGRKKERTDRGGKKQQNEGKKNKKEQKGTKQGQSRKQATKRRKKEQKKGQNEGKRSKRNESGTKGKETGTKRKKATEKA